MGSGPHPDNLQPAALRRGPSCRRSEAFLLNPHPVTARTAREWGVPNGKVLSRARDLAPLDLKAPEVSRRNTRVHFIQPLKERIVREVGYGPSLEGASAADLVRSMEKAGAAAAAAGRRTSDILYSKAAAPSTVNAMTETGNAHCEESGGLS